MQRRTTFDKINAGRRGLRRSQPICRLYPLYKKPFRYADVFHRPCPRAAPSFFFLASRSKERRAVETRSFFPRFSLDFPLIINRDVFCGFAVPRRLRRSEDASSGSRRRRAEFRGVESRRQRQQREDRVDLLLRRDDRRRKRAGLGDLPNRVRTSRQSPRYRNRPCDGPRRRRRLQRRAVLVLEQFSKQRGTLFLPARPVSELRRRSRFAGRSDLVPASVRRRRT